MRGDRYAAPRDRCGGSVGSGVFMKVYELWGRLGAALMRVAAGMETDGEEEDREKREDTHEQEDQRNKKKAQEEKEDNEEVRREEEITEG